MANLQDLIDAIYNRDGANGGETLVIANHLQQMKEFGRRKGIEFYPAQDDDEGSRFKFINNLFKQNKLDLYLDRFWDILLCKGQILFYLRPTGNTYKIYWYPKDSFRAYYDGEGELIEVQILYSYKVKAPMGMGAVANFGNEKWLKLKITKETIWRTESDQPLSLDSDLEIHGIASEETINSLGFIPCVVCNNYVLGPGQDGIDEFSWLRSQIEALDRMQAGVSENLEFFANPTLVATRSPGELVENGVSAGVAQRPSISSNSGFYSQTYGSTRKQDPQTRAMGGTGMRVRRVIGNVRPEERFGYVSSDAVSGDHNQHIAAMRESIRIALGGVDEIGINSGATAFEIKSLYGRAAATAQRKCLNLYTYGLCKIFEMAIVAEEKLFRDSLASIMEQGYAKQIKLKLDPNIPAINQINDDLIFDLVQQGMLPSGTIGLIPNGDTTVVWRFMGPVFEDSTQDQLNKSIMVRNLQELGVASPEALQVLFPEMTDSERMEMLTGLPFRMGQSIIGLINQVLGLIQQTSQMPDPVNPQFPLSNRIDLSPVLQKCISSLLQELSYGKRFDPAKPTIDVSSVPSTGERSNDASTDAGTGASDSRALAESQYAIPVQPGFGDSASAYWGTIDPLLPITEPGAISNPTARGSYSATSFGMERGFQQTPGYPQYSSIPDWQSPLPTPGSTAADNSNPTRRSEQATNQLQPTQPITTAPIPADLATQPDLLQQLFPTFTAMANTVRGNGKPSSKSKRSRSKK